MVTIYFWIPCFDKSIHKRDNYGDQVILKFIIYKILKSLFITTLHTLI